MLENQGGAVIPVSTRKSVGLAEKTKSASHTHNRALFNTIDSAKPQSSFDAYAERMESLRSQWQ